MIYDPEKLSKEALIKILFIMKQLRMFREVRGENPFLFFISDYDKNDDDFRIRVIRNLAKDKRMSISKYWFWTLSFKVTGYIKITLKDSFYDLLQQIENRLELMNGVPMQKRISFDEHNSILYFNGYKIPISLQKNRNNAHYVLKHIFESDEGIDTQFTYGEIAMETFREDYVDYKKYYRACEDIRNKVFEVSGILDLLSFSTGQNGWVQLNKHHIGIED